MNRADLKNKDGLTEKEFLEKYDAGKYERPSNTVDMLIFTIIEAKLKLLMIKRGDHPYLGMWALPGGFVNIDENLDTAAQRELKEETGLDNIYMEQIYTWGDVNRDPRTRIITIAYMALVNADNLKPEAADDADLAKWFDINCKLIDKSSNKFKNSYITDYNYKLTLESDCDKLSAAISKKKIIENRTAKTILELTASENIASDHGKIIYHALEVLKTKSTNLEFMINLVPNSIKDIDEILAKVQNEYIQIINQNLLF